MLPELNYLELTFTAPTELKLASLMSANFSHRSSSSVQIPTTTPKCVPQLPLYLPGSISSTVQSGWAPRGPSCPCCGGHHGRRWLCCCRWGHGSTASSPSLSPPSSGRRQRMPPRWWEGSGSPSHTPCLQRGEKEEEQKVDIRGRRGDGENTSKCLFWIKRRRKDEITERGASSQSHTECRFFLNSRWDDEGAGRGEGPRWEGERGAVREDERQEEADVGGA